MELWKVHLGACLLNYVKILCTEFVAVILATVPYLLIVLLDISLSVKLSPLTLLLLVVVELSLEGVMLEGVLGWHLFRVSRTMW